MFQILILVCSLDVPRLHCQVDTAIDVIYGPEVPNELMCGMRAQAFLAQTALAPRSGREYAKILCVRVPGGRETRQAPEGEKPDEEATGTVRH